MSTLLYGASNNPNTNGIGVFNDESGKKTLVAGLLALIPAESLAAYAFVFTAATTTTTLSNGETQVSFETLAGMDWVFWAFVFLPAAFYWITARSSVWSVPGVMKMLLPCAAMFFWLMIENPSMFDMAFPDTSKAVRIVVPVLGAVLVLAMATRFELPKKETGQQEAREEAQVPLAGRQAEG